MNKTNNWKVGSMYSNWYYMVILLVGVSIIIGYMFSFVLNSDFTFIHVFLQSIFSTTLIWGGCISIVVYTWKKYPWERVPVRHLIIEISAIVLLLTVFFLGSNTVMYLKGKTRIKIIYNWYCHHHHHHVPDYHHSRSCIFLSTMEIEFFKINKSRKG